MPSLAPTVQPTNNFETNNRGRRKSASNRPVLARERLVGPTPERVAKGDVVRMDAGHHRAPPPIERMRDREQLAPGDPALNEQLFLAAEKLLELFTRAGMSAGAQAQDINRVIGSGDAANGAPMNEQAAKARQELRLVLKLIGWHSAYPHRGAGRLTLDVIVYEMSVTDAAAKHRPGGSDSGRLGAGMDVLREGLFGLAVHWRMLRG